MKGRTVLGFASTAHASLLPCTYLSFPPLSILPLRPSSSWRLVHPASKTLAEVDEGPGVEPKSNCANEPAPLPPSFFPSLSGQSIQTPHLRGGKVGADDHVEIDEEAVWIGARVAGVTGDRGEGVHRLDAGEAGLGTLSREETRAL